MRALWYPSVEITNFLLSPLNQQKKTVNNLITSPIDIISYNNIKRLGNTYFVQNLRISRDIRN